MLKECIAKFPGCLVAFCLVHAPFLMLHFIMSIDIKHLVFFCKSRMISRLQSDILEQIVIIPSGFEQTSRQGFFLLKFPSFFEKRRFWRAMPGGPHVGGFPPRRARCFQKKRKKIDEIIYALLQILKRDLDGNENLRKENLDI